MGLISVQRMSWVAVWDRPSRDCWLWTPWWRYRFPESDVGEEVSVRASEWREVWLRLQDFLTSPCSGGERDRRKWVSAHPPEDDSLSRTLWSKEIGAQSGSCWSTMSGPLEPHCMPQRGPSSDTEHSMFGPRQPAFKGSKKSLQM